jgi:hypothetical protein
VQMGTSSVSVTPPGSDPWLASLFTVLLNGENMQSLNVFPVVGEGFTTN